MNSFVLRRHATKFLPMLLAVIAGPVALKATTLAATPATLNFTCNTATGPSAAQTVNLKSSAAIGVNSYVVTFGLPSNGITVTAPGATTLNAATNGAGLTYTVSLSGSCTGVTNGATTFNFKVGGTTDVLITVNVVLTSTTSGLTVGPAGVIALTCQKNGGTTVPGPLQTMSVTSALTGGLPFTVDTSVNPAAAWLTIAPTTGGTATSVATTFTVVAASGCGGFAANTTNTTIIHLVNAPGAPPRTSR
jgi:hypothetical protein